MNNSNLLPNQAVGYIYKDHSGFFWISTIDGLCRYDGKDIVLYKNNVNDPFSIKDNNTGTIAEDNNGNIWVSHQKGISCLNISTGKFINYSSTDGNSLIFDRAVIRIDKAGTIFNTSANGYGLSYFDKKNKKFVAINIDTANDGFNNKQNPNSLIGQLSEQQTDGTFYMISVHGVFQFDPKTFKRKRICNSSEYSPQSILKDHTGKIWFAEWDGGLSVIDEATKTRRSIIKEKDSGKRWKTIIGPLTEYKDLNGKYWILAGEWSTGSLVITDPVTEKYQYQVLKIENEIVPNIIAGIIHCDADGKIYVCSGLGIFTADPVRQNIQNEYTYERGKPADIFYDNLVRSGIQLNNGGYVFGLLEYNGLRFYDSNFVFTKAIKNYNSYGKEYDLDVRNFFQIAPEKYLLSGRTGFALLDNGFITPISYISKQYKNTDTVLNKARDVLPINANKYWVRMSDGGVKKFDSKTKKFVQEYFYADRAGKIPLNNVGTMIYDNDGRLWINNDGHLYIYNNVTDEFVQQSINQNKKRINPIRNFCFDKRHNIWVTGADGLLKHNLTTEKEEIFTTKNGLQNANTYKVAADNENNLWILHQTGISKLNSTTDEIENYSQKDGLPLPVMEYDVPFFIDNKNNLILGNDGIATRINISQLGKIETPLPKIDITTVQGIDSSILMQENNEQQKSTVLTFKDFPVSINFSIIDFGNKNDRKYYYRYKGKDTSWIECNNGSVLINTITPGVYEMEVTGSVNGIFAAKTDSIRFTISPQWYQTWLFKSIAILLTLFSLALLYNWRINTATKNESQQTEIQRLAAEQYKNKWELEQISNYFTTSLVNLNTKEEVLWDVAKNLIGKLGFEDCILYLWNDDKTRLLQKAGYGPKGSIEEIDKLPFDVVPGQGVVGYVAATKESVLIKDTRVDSRYRVDEMQRLSEICVPLLYENELLGVIDSEHHQPGFFSLNHLQLLNTIAAYTANKLMAITNKEVLEKNKMELATTIDNLKGAQLDALRSQMNPHFIFNSLNSIENFILKNEKLVASEYLGKFSRLIRNILDNSQSEKISLAKEIETLQLYIELERIRTNNNFDVVFEMPDDILDDNIMLPPMLMQPHAENAILHGIRHLENKKGTITISLKIINEEYLEYILEDNGIGRKKSVQQKSTTSFAHKSYGINITQNRIDLYNQKSVNKISYTIVDLYNAAMQGTGTKIIISIPLT